MRTGAAQTSVESGEQFRQTAWVYLTAAEDECRYDELTQRLGAQGIPFYGTPRQAHGTPLTALRIVFSGAADARHGRNVYVPVAKLDEARALVAVPRASHGHEGD